MLPQVRIVCVTTVEIGLMPLIEAEFADDLRLVKKYI